MNGPEVRARLSLDSSQFTKGIEGANSKLSRFASGLSGMGGGFRGFAAINEAIAASNGSAKSFLTSLIGVASIAGPLAAIAAIMKGMAASAESSAASFDSFGRGGNNKGIFGSEWLDKYERLMWLFTPKWAGGDFFMPMPNADTRRGRQVSEQDEAIKRAAAGIKGQSVEQRIREWMDKEGVSPREANRIKDRMLMEQAADADIRRKGGDSYAKIGLGIGYGSGMDFAQETAKNTLSTVQALSRLTAILTQNPMAALAVAQ
jgi:hypothetical protein